MIVFPRGEAISFEFPKLIRVLFPGENDEILFNGVQEILIESSGVISILKTDGGQAEIYPPYRYVEVTEALGDIDD